MSDMNKMVDELQVGDGATHRIYTDKRAGTVIRRTEKSIWVQLDSATLLNGPQSGEPDALEVFPGGFAANVQGRQRYSYERNPNGQVLRFTRRKGGGWKLAGHRGPGNSLSAGRHEFYDYNF